MHQDFHSPWLDMSRSTIELFGFPPDVRRVALEDFYERVHSEDAPAVRAAIEKAIEDRSDLALEFRRSPEKGGERWVQFSGRVLSDEEPLRVVAVAVDTTGRRRRDTQRRQSQKLEALAELAG